MRLQNFISAFLTHTFGYSTSLMKYLIASLLLLISFAVSAQKNTYNDSLKTFREQYIKTHEVVKGDDAKFLNFFPADKKYRVIAKFKKVSDLIGFDIPTAAGTSSHYYKYGSLTFKLNDTVCRLFLYRSQRLMSSAEYKNYLFLPFTDLTTGNETYGGGRYIDLRIPTKGDEIIINFNKAYNPFCAYSKNYSCPKVPAENDLNVKILAGVKIK